MEPVIYQFEIRRGATDVLGVELATQDVFTQRVQKKTLDGGTIAKWKIDIPGEPIERTTAQGGGLVYDADTGVLLFSLSAAQTAGLPADVPMRTVITIVEASGGVDIWLDGTVIARG